MAQLSPQRIGGGAFGLGGTLAARQFFDEPGQDRLTQPSVLFGAGTGLLAGALWFTDIDTPVLGDSFWASHALTSLPTAAFFAAFPKQSGTTTTEQVRKAVFGNAPTSGGSSGGSTGSERVRSNGVSVEKTRTGRAR